MSTAKSGDTVLVHYTGKLQDGSVFDTSEEREPLEFRLGDGDIIPGFQDAILGMLLGETKTTAIPPEAAYGPHRAEMVLEFGMDQVPDDMEPQVGHRLELQTMTGEAVPARVVEVSENSIKVDANHPLAGEKLTFEIRLVEIK
jgi:FKBP-type peptidyl-prolyl cis-trans isomerase 2